MSDPPRRNPAIDQYLSTEHFTLESARASTTGEANSRLLIYISSLSSSIVSLALVAQISRLGNVFFIFALILLPSVYLLGLMTLGRLNQIWDAWFMAGQGISRIRHYYVQQAPEIAEYLIMPTHDDPWSVLGGMGLVERWWGRYVTAGAVVATLNSLVAGVTGCLIGRQLDRSSLVWVITLGISFLLISLLSLFVAVSRNFRKRIAAVDVKFPAT